MVSVFMAISAVISLVTIISIYREGGILKRLRATPLRPHTILSAHVLVKLLFTAVTLTLMILAGRRYYPAGLQAPVISFALRAAVEHAGDPVDRLRDRERGAHGALRAAGRRDDLLSDARRCQACSCRWTRCRPACRWVAKLLPMTYVVSLLRGIWAGESWFAHLGDLAALAISGAVFVAISARVFRWE